MAERVSVLNHFVFHGTVVDSAEDAGVERNGVRRESTVSKACLIRHHDLSGDIVEHYVFISTEHLEAV